MKLDAAQQDTLHDYVWNTLEAVSDGSLPIDKARDRMMDAIEASSNSVSSLMASIQNGQESRA